IAHLGGTVPNAETVRRVIDEYLDYGQRLQRYLADASRLIHDESQRGRHILFEGAQGTLLDVDHGTYPFVTSSSTTAGGACSGAGGGPPSTASWMGFARPSSPRAGGGPSPPGRHDAGGSPRREPGGEFGAAPGGARRCGWLDVAALRLAVRLNGLAGVA